MARPIEYQLDHVLDAAMTLFCEKGFEATSIRDLVTATGLTSRSLYNVFECKDGLFKAAIEKFRNDKALSLYKVMEEGRGKSALEALFGMLTPRECGNGCLMVNTLNECNAVGDSGLAVAQNHIQRMETLFVEKLEEARQDGDFNGNSEIIAKLFVLVIQGGSVYSRQESNIQHIESIYNEMLRLISL